MFGPSENGQFISETTGWLSSKTRDELRFCNLKEVIATTIASTNNNRMNI